MKHALLPLMCVLVSFQAASAAPQEAKDSLLDQQISAESLKANITPGAVIDFPKETYDATYEQQDPNHGSYQRRTVCDGKGHLRVELTIAGSKNITLMDWPKSTMTQLLEPMHMAIQLPFAPQVPKELDSNELKGAKVKALGAKVLAGYPCHGYESVQGEVVAETWIADNIHHLVRSVVKTPRGTGVTELKTFSSAAPDASLFVVPPEYQSMPLQFNFSPGATNGSGMPPNAGMPSMPNMDNIKPPSMQDVQNMMQSLQNFQNMRNLQMPNSGSTANPNPNTTMPKPPSSDGSNTP